jgi:DNA modification methylase
VTIKVIHGDCLVEIPKLAAAGERFHACVCDPPYHLTSIVKRFSGASVERENYAMNKSHSAYMSRGFMGKAWDGGDVSFRPETWRAVYDVLLPGAHLVAMGGTRTYHRLVCAIEDAGFEVRDTAAFLYGSGFPKSRNISKDLAALPACSCRVAKIGADLGNIVNAPLPPGDVGASVGTEPTPMPTTRTSANEAARLAPQSGAIALAGQPVVQSGIEDRIGQLDPVVLGPFDVARTAEGEQVVEPIGGGQVDPESLRDEVVWHKSNLGATVGAPLVSRDDSGGPFAPMAPFVTPSAAAPCRIAAANETPGIVIGHASARAVDAGLAADLKIGDELNGASETDEARHSSDYATKRLTAIQCLRCGGVIPENIPSGYGTALKPAMELICVARKPLSESSVAGNVLKHGCGALNINASRVEASDQAALDANWDRGMTTDIRGGNYVGGKPQGVPVKPRTTGREGEASAERRYTEEGATNFAAKPGTRRPLRVAKRNEQSDLDLVAYGTGLAGSEAAGTTSLGRWPANIAHDGSEEVLAAFPNAPGHQRFVGAEHGDRPSVNCYGDYGVRPDAPPRGDSGSAARFFYSAKADRADRADSKHPTVKPVDLIRWLVTLVCPPGGHVLDCFAGSGTTGEACMLAGFDCTLIERDAQHVKDVEHRIKRWSGLDAPLFGGGEP